MPCILGSSKAFKKPLYSEDDLTSCSGLPPAEQIGEAHSTTSYCEQGTQTDDIRAGTDQVFPDKYAQQQRLERNTAELDRLKLELEALKGYKSALTEFEFTFNPDLPPSVSSQAEKGLQKRQDDNSSGQLSSHSSRPSFG